MRMCKLECAIPWSGIFVRKLEFDDSHSLRSSLRTKQSEGRSVHLSIWWEGPKDFSMVPIKMGARAKKMIFMIQGAKAAHEIQ